MGAERRHAGDDGGAPHPAGAHRDADGGDGLPEARGRVDGPCLVPPWAREGDQALKRSLKLLACAGLGVTGACATPGGNGEEVAAGPGGAHSRAGAGAAVAGGRRAGGHFPAADDGHRRAARAVTAQGSRQGLETLMAEQGGQRSSILVAMLAASVLLAACAGGPQPTRQYAWSVDSVSSTCVRSPANCPPAVGQAGAATTTASGSLVGAAAAGGLVVRPSRDLEEEETAAINKALEECADQARAEVMLKYFKDGRPTKEQCEEVVSTDRRGQSITRAMQLGIEQHEVALRCAEAQLSKVRKPGCFILSPRYRYDPSTGRTDYIPREVVEELLRQGRGEELKGTLEPDIVICEQDPRQVQGVYDFKFPCMNTSRRSPWRRYPEGHPYGKKDQGEMYQEALRVPPKLVQPHLGTHR